MDALPLGASLPLRGSVTGACFRLEDWVCFDPFFRLFLKCRAIRVPSLVVGWVRVGEVLALTMVSSRVSGAARAIDDDSIVNKNGFIK